MITISETAHEYIRRELAEHLPRSVNEIEGRGIIPHARLGTQEFIFVSEILEFRI